MSSVRGTNTSRLLKPISKRTKFIQIIEEMSLYFYEKMFVKVNILKCIKVTKKTQQKS